MTVDAVAINNGQGSKIGYTSALLNSALSVPSFSIECIEHRVNTIMMIRTNAGNYWLIMTAGELTDDTTLYIDGKAFPVADATRAGFLNNGGLIWKDVEDLGWSAGDTVQLSIKVDDEFGTPDPVTPWETVLTSNLTVARAIEGTQVLSGYSDALVGSALSHQGFAIDNTIIKVTSLAEAEDLQDNYVTNINIILGVTSEISDGTLYLNGKAFAIGDSTYDADAGTHTWTDVDDMYWLSGDNVWVRLDAPIDQSIVR